MDTIQKQKLLDEVARDIAATKGGPLEGPGQNPVPGEGSPDAKVMFIGEAPGYHENEQKRPFVGVSGQLLRKTMAENGFPPEDVFITNIVKFRPPGNRDPLPEEIEFFQPFLDKQIAIIDPKIIVTVGRFSMYKFLGVGVSISKIHGQARKIGERYIFPMFHSAAALRAGDVMKSFLDDFKKLKAFADKPEKPKVAEIKKIESQQMELV
ncbi:MAG: uracil-DNA glycosylase [Patescibacteria group bacterium]